jgi:hypothetical protein
MTFHVTICFICVIITRTGYSFLSKQSVLSGRMRPRFLSLNRLSELVWEPELWSRSNSSYEDEGGFENDPWVSHLQPDRPTFRGHESRSSFSSIASDEEEIFQSGPGQQVKHQHFAVNTALWPSEKWSTRLYNGPHGAKSQWSAPYIMTDQAHLAFSCCILRNLWHC